MKVRARLELWLGDRQIHSQEKPDVILSSDTCYTLHFILPTIERRVLPPRDWCARMAPGYQWRRKGDERRNPNQKPGAPSVRNPLGQWYGRRKGDERRHGGGFNGVPSPTNPLGIWRGRRKTDERRGPHHNYGYESSRDPRVRELERRRPLTVSFTAGFAGEAKAQRT